MSDYNSTTREFGWDDEIQRDDTFQVLPEGDYRFTVTRFERARHSGSEKIPACPKAVLTLAVSGPEGSGEVQTNLFLHSKFEWKLCQFFTSVGQRKHGEAMRMNWGAVPGSGGVCHVTVRKWTGNNGKERESNEISEFYAPDNAPQVSGQAAPRLEQGELLMELRPYQEEARRAVERDWAGDFLRTLLVLPTGCGKTIVFSKIVEDRVRQGDRCLILAHRGELLDQAADKLLKATGLRCAVEKAEETCLGSWYRVAVGSVQSLQRPARLARFESDYFNCVVVDEAHHVLSDGYQRVLEHFPDARVLGVTATPDRGDMRNLGQYFEHLAYEYTLPKAIKEGYLCPIKAVTIPLKLDLSGVGVQGGDFKSADIDTALDPYLHQIASEMRQYCKGRRTVVFLPLVKTSQKFRDILEQNGFRAAEVNGNSQDRAEVLRDFEDGKYDVLCNSMLLTEGWDCPSVDCVVVLRPTKVRSLYSQMVGRGTRLHPGKSDLLLLDFLWHTERHELCRPACLICEEAAVAQKMTEVIEQAGGPLDIEEAQQAASEDVVAQREEALAKQLSEMRSRKRKLVDPLQFEMSIAAADLAGYVPAFGWEMGPPTEKQRSALEKFGIFPDEIGSAGKASLLLDRLSKRRTEGLSTPRQIRVLENFGFRNVGTWPFQDAKNMIDRMAAGGRGGRWRVPSGVDPATYVPVGR